jgi:alpha-1,2-mannosyltransferase
MSICPRGTSFSKFLNSRNDKKNYKLMLVGSCRNDGDSQRVEELKMLCSRLKVEKYVEFKLNISFDELNCPLVLSCIFLNSDVLQGG